MKLDDLLAHTASNLSAERETAMNRGLDAPIDLSSASHFRTVGSLHLYRCQPPPDRSCLPDVPMTLLPGNDLEPTEGCIWGIYQDALIFQTYDHVGETLSHGTIIPDTSGFLETGESRLHDMSNKPDAFTLGPAERLAAWLDPHPESNQAGVRDGIPSTILTTFWGDDRQARWSKLTAFIVDQIRKNKRILVVAPDHLLVDELTGSIAHSLKMAALPYKSLLCRYEASILEAAAGIPLQELGFEAQMFQFFAKANSNKASLRKKYDRFRELTPILAYKREKQKDLNEVKLLEWRLLTQLSDWQGKIKQIDKIVADYEALPIWKRLGLQVAGKNIETLAEYRVIYESKIKGLMGEVEVAQTRIKELIPEATIAKEMRPEYDELKEEIKRLGGTRKIREMLSAGEGTNRQAFAQNKRIMATTPGKILSDPLFKKVPYDLLVVEEAPRIPAPLIFIAAGLIRERIILSGDMANLRPSPTPTPTSGGIWPQDCLDLLHDPSLKAAGV